MLTTLRAQHQPVWACNIRRMENGTAPEVFTCSDCSSCRETVQQMYKLGSPVEARTFLDRFLTCCGEKIRHDARCGTCSETPSVTCKCVRCNDECGGNKWAAIPDNEQKKKKTALEKTRLTVEENRVRANLPGVPDDLIGDFARVPDGAVSELLKPFTSKPDDLEDLQRRLKPSESYTRRLGLVQSHGGITPALSRAVARTGEIAPAWI